MPAVVAIGVMSGTSCDGVDAVMIELASLRRRHEPRVLGHVHRSFSRALTAELLRPLDLRLDRLAELHFLLPEIYARVVRDLPRWSSASVCGMHGQTVWHAPSKRRGRVPCTYQIGSSAVLAHRLGMPVVGDLRGADVALGGQGAPIVPFAHWFFTPADRAPRLVVNFGGICNVTWVPRRADDVVACDVGPGMMLSDAYASLASGGRVAFDRGGCLSRGGKVVASLVEEIVEHPFIRRRPPKSTGREDFGRSYFTPLFRKYAREKPADVALSLLVATAEILRDAADRLPGKARGLKEVVLSGGGAKNPVLVREVKSRFLPVPLLVNEGGVFAPEHHEAASMALIAARTLARLESSLTRVTGASRAAVLGHVHTP
jgi:anhydro-N-acetylmuramic acid kinase